MARTNYLDIGAVQFGAAKRLDIGVQQRIEVVGASLSPAAAALALSTVAPLRLGSSNVSPAVANLALAEYAAVMTNSGIQRNLLIGQGFTGGIYG